MNKILYFSFTAFFAWMPLGESAQQLGTREQGVTCTLADSGSIEKLVFYTSKGEEKVAFRKDDWKGPSFGKKIQLAPQQGKEVSFTGNKDGISYRLDYALSRGALTCTATLTNTTDQDFSPKKVPFIIGIDTFMNKYPEWNELYFPTFFRCEKQSFWGYLMSPNGKILSVTSPEAIASYTINYVQEMYGHYIYTVTLDLLCAPPLPAQHPVLSSLKAGETKSWAITLAPVEKIDNVESEVVARTQTPLISLKSHSLEPGQTQKLDIAGASPARVSIMMPSGKSIVHENVRQMETDQTLAYGLYQIEAQNAEGKLATASFYVHPSWGWYLQQSRQQALFQTPRADKGNDSCETWYGLFGFYLAEKYYPDASMRYMGDELLAEVLRNLFQKKDGKLWTSTYPERIQNVSAMLCVLTDKYAATGSAEALEQGAECAEFLLSRQQEKGYYGGPGKQHYTSVLYIAKALLEFMDEIKPLTQKDKLWKDRYERYENSVKRAVDEMAARGREVSTEGQATFEDGAVSCSSLQLLDYALRQPDDTTRGKYSVPGLQYLQDHACLTRLLDPDARSRGATSRFWECWGDIRSPFQAMLSPHGWSGWRLYASYYAYLLTGEEKRLVQLMDAMGSCTQLVNFPTGEVLYAFVTDPQIQAGDLVKDASNPGGKFIAGTKGACYLKNIGDWFGKRTTGEGYLEKASWDWVGGTSYEIIKAMEEIVLPHAFVCELSDGSFLAYHCKVERQGEAVSIIPSEDLVKKVHINLKKKSPVCVRFPQQEVRDTVEGMKWIKKNEK